MPVPHSGMLMWSQITSQQMKTPPHGTQGLSWSGHNPSASIHAALTGAMEDHCGALLASSSLPSSPHKFHSSHNALWSLSWACQNLVLSASFCWSNVSQPTKLTLVSPSWPIPITGKDLLPTQYSHISLFTTRNTTHNALLCFATSLVCRKPSFSTRWWSP